MIEHRSPGDYLLAWASETESGSWSDLRSAAGHLIGLHAIRRRPWMFANQLVDLGHLDIDWEEGLWSIARPCLALSHGMGFYAFLAGWRPPHLERCLDAVAEDLGCTVRLVSQDHAPHAIYVGAEDAEQLHGLAEKLELPLVVCPAQGILDTLPSDLIAVGRPASAPTLDDELRYFNPCTGEWQQTQSRDANGLYSFDLHGQRDFRFKTEQDWFHVDRAIGQLLVLQGREDIMGWHPRNPDNRTPRVLTVPSGLSLPPLVERAAVASSGLLPQITESRRVFRNVTRRVAQGITQSVGLVLAENQEPFQPNPEGS
jgi:hypothetical protein